MTGHRWGLRYALAVSLVLLVPARARADYHVYSPYEIDLGELELEHNGDAVFDRRSSRVGASSYTVEIGTGLTAWWHSEIEFGYNRAPGAIEPTLLTQLVTENTIQLTEPGEYFLDAGVYAEYGQSLTGRKHGAYNEVTFGPLLAKDIGRTTTTVNLFLTRELGPNQDSHGLDFSYAWQTRWNIWRPLSPAIEIYGDTGSITHMAGFARQQILVGPVAIGAVNLNSLGLGHGGQLRYELGWLFGATRTTASNVLRWRLEMEIPF